MREKILLFLTLSGLWSLSSCEAVRKFHYVTEKKTWTEAQSYCRNNYDDLASLVNMEDVTSLLKNRESHMDRLNSQYAWIGLSDDRGNWTWSLNDTGHHKNTHYTNWGEGKPDKFGKKGIKLICTSMESDGSWIDRQTSCYTGFKLHSVCYNGSAYFLQTTPRSWVEAQEYCRREYMDLASVMDETENTEIANKLKQRAWIGLYRKPWAYWSDQRSVNFTHWEEGEPNRYNEHCVTISTNTGKWYDYRCVKKSPFVCQEKATTQTRLKVKISSGADVNDPEVQRQLLQQMRARLEKEGMSDFKLRWTQDGNIFHEEEKKKN